MDTGVKTCVSDFYVYHVIFIHIKVVNAYFDTGIHYGEVKRDRVKIQVGMDTYGIIFL